MVWVILEALIRTGGYRCGTPYLSLLKPGRDRRYRSLQRCAAQGAFIPKAEEQILLASGDKL